MARLINKLSAIGIARLKRKGLYGDGGGLYLRVSSSGGKFWVFRYMVCGKAREMGLGALHAVSLAEARAEARSNRHMLTNREDPLEVRRKAKAKSQLLNAKKKTFKECAEAYIKSHKSGWRNPKHRQQWNSTLTSYAYPVLGELDVQKIDVGLIMKVLEPLWLTKTETASRL